VYLFNQNLLTFNNSKTSLYQVTLKNQESVWTENESPSIKTYTLSNFRNLPQLQTMSEEKKFEMEVVGNVLPFKTNNYVVEQLIDWNNIPNDPIFVLTFPQKDIFLCISVAFRKVLCHH